MNRHASRSFIRKMAIVLTVALTLGLIPWAGLAPQLHVAHATVNPAVTQAVYQYDVNAGYLILDGPGTYNFDFSEFATGTNVALYSGYGSQLMSGSVEQTGLVLGPLVIYEGERIYARINDETLMIGLFTEGEKVIKLEGGDVGLLDVVLDNEYTYYLQIDSIPVGSQSTFEFYEYYIISNIDIRVYPGIKYMHYGSVGMVVEELQFVEPYKQLILDVDALVPISVTAEQSQLPMEANLLVEVFKANQGQPYYYQSLLPLHLDVQELRLHDNMELISLGYKVDDPVTGLTFQFHQSLWEEQPNVIQYGGPINELDFEYAEGFSYRANLYDSGGSHLEFIYDVQNYYYPVFDIMDDNGAVTYFAEYWYVNSESPTSTQLQLQGFSNNGQTILKPAGLVDERLYTDWHLLNEYEVSFKVLDSNNIPISGQMYGDHAYLLDNPAGNNVTIELTVPIHSGTAFMGNHIFAENYNSLIVDGKVTFEGVNFSENAYMYITLMNEDFNEAPPSLEHIYFVGYLGQDEHLIVLDASEIYPFDLYLLDHTGQVYYPEIPDSLTLLLAEFARQNGGEDAWVGDVFFVLPERIYNFAVIESIRLNGEPESENGVDDPEIYASFVSVGLNYLDKYNRLSLSMDGLSRINLDYTNVVSYSIYALGLDYPYTMIAQDKFMDGALYAVYEDEGDTQNSEESHLPPFQYFYMDAAKIHGMSYTMMDDNDRPFNFYKFLYFIQDGAVLAATEEKISQLALLQLSDSIIPHLMTDDGHVYQYDTDTGNDGLRPQFNIYFKDGSMEPTNDFFLNNLYGDMDRLEFVGFVDQSGYLVETSMTDASPEAPLVAYLYNQVDVHLHGAGGLAIQSEGHQVVAYKEVQGDQYFYLGEVIDGIATFYLPAGKYQFYTAHDQLFEIPWLIQTAYVEVEVTDTESGPVQVTLEVVPIQTPYGDTSGEPITLKDLLWFAAHIRLNGYDMNQDGVSDEKDLQFLMQWIPGVYDGELLITH